MIFRHSLLLLFTILAVTGFSQNDTTPAKNTLTAGVNYQSRLHFFGRTDDLKSSGLFPTIGAESKIGLYANANFIFVNNAETSLQYNGTVVEAGYKFPNTRNFSGNVFYTQFLYSNQSELVQSALRSQTGINVSYNNSIVNVNAGGDVKFSDRTDFGITAGLDKLFIFVIPNTKSAVAINPSAYAYAGTQNFTETYTRKNNPLGLPIGPQQSATVKETQLNILAYELSMPMIFVKGKFNVSITPSYVIPQNLVVFPARPNLSETGENMLYVTMGVGVRL